MVRIGEFAAGMIAHCAQYHLLGFWHARGEGSSRLAWCLVAKQACGLSDSRFSLARVLLASLAWALSVACGAGQVPWVLPASTASANWQGAETRAEPCGDDRDAAERDSLQRAADAGDRGPAVHGTCAILSQAWEFCGASSDYRLLSVRHRASSGVGGATYARARAPPHI